MKDEEEKRKDRAQKRKKTRRSVIYGLTVILVFVTILTVQVVRTHNKYKSYAEEEQRLQQELEEEQAKKEDLETEKEYMQSQEYIEDEAKRRLGMVKDNEIIFRENDD